MENRNPLRVAVQDALDYIHDDASVPARALRRKLEAALAEQPKTYPVGDAPTLEETGNAPLTERLGLGNAKRHYRVVLTGEKRCPKAGEWYLSGAVPAGYRAHSDLTSAYHIAKLVKVERETVETITVIG